MVSAAGSALRDWPDAFPQIAACERFELQFAVNVKFFVAICKSSNRRGVSPWPYILVQPWFVHPFEAFMVAGFSCFFLQYQDNIVISADVRN
jgi:hypothetical protein